ncbi:hypothetical protein D3C75_894010 [compost metagenome]
MAIVDLQDPFFYGDPKLRGKIDTTIFILRGETAWIIERQLIVISLIERDDKTSPITIQLATVFVNNDIALVSAFDDDEHITLAILV